MSEERRRSSIGRVVVILRGTTGRRRGRGIGAHMYRRPWLFVRSLVALDGEETRRPFASACLDSAVCKANAVVMLPWFCEWVGFGFGFWFWLWVEVAAAEPLNPRYISRALEEKFFPLAGRPEDRNGREREEKGKVRKSIS